MRPARMDGKALASLLLGLLSLGGCTGPILGLPAIVLGAISRRDIDRAQGGLTGRGLATGGIVTGFVGTGIGAVLFLLVVRATIAPPTPQTSADVNASAAPPAPAPITSPVIALPPDPPELLMVRPHPSLEVIDVDPSRPLEPQLAELVQRSPGRTVVLQTYLPANAACAAVAAALPDRRTQGALANVTLVRVDARKYSVDLARLHVETRTAPWFYKLDESGAPTDALSGHRWAAKAADTIAPALGRFVQQNTP